MSRAFLVFIIAVLAIGIATESNAAKASRFTAATLAAVRALVGDPIAFDLRGKNFRDPKSVAELNLNTPDNPRMLDALMAAQRLYRVKPDLDLVLDLMARGIDSPTALSVYLQSQSPAPAAPSSGMR